VENAIKHGLSMRPDEGWLRLTANQLKGRLTVTLEDSGSGSVGDAVTRDANGAGVGLANVTRRLQLFGTKIQFSIALAKVPGH
jgi:LytS/YehU family sensor histidine kinase